MLRTARSEGQRPRPFLGVAYGPGRPEPGPERQDATRNLASAFASLKPLPFARDEVLAGARVAGPESVLLDGAATESALKAERSETSRSFILRCTASVILPTLIELDWCLRLAIRKKMASGRQERFENRE